jgi:hypothetical protein
MNTGYSDYETLTEHGSGSPSMWWRVPLAFTKLLSNFEGILSGRPCMYSSCVAIRDYNTKRLLWHRDPDVLALNRLLEEE